MLDCQCGAGVEPITGKKCVSCAAMCKNIGFNRTDHQYEARARVAGEQVRAFVNYLKFSINDSLLFGSAVKARHLLGNYRGLSGAARDAGESDL